jgi:hypothetical protein
MYRIQRVCPALMWHAMQHVSHLKVIMLVLRFACCMNCLQTSVSQMSASMKEVRQAEEAAAAPAPASAAFKLNSSFAMLGACRMRRYQSAHICQHTSVSSSCCLALRKALVAQHKLLSS